MDINTATSSAKTSPETNINTQTQRVNKGEGSFLDEMNKFSAEQTENLQNNTENQTSEAVMISQNNIHTNTKKTSQDIQSPKSDNLLNTPNNKKTSQSFSAEALMIQQTTHKGKTQSAEANANILNPEQVLDPLTSLNNIKPNIEKNSKPEEFIQTESAIKNLVTDKPEEFIQTESVIKNLVTDKPEKFIQTESVIKNLVTDKPEKTTQSNNKPQDVIQSKIEKQVTLNEKTIEQTSKKQKNNSKAENIIDKTLQDSIIEQTQQILNEKPINATPVIIPIQAENIPAQTQKINTVETLINANKQLADIALLTEAKVVNTPKTEKESAKVDYTTIKMSSDDAVFFADLIQDTEKTLQNVMSDLQSEVEQKVQETSKNVKISATLMNAISEAAKTNQPMRIDFDKDVSIIIKIDKDGAINAKFIPGDKAVEEYLKQNIASLRQRFDEQELNYRDLSYSNRQKHNQENNRRNNKEKDHE